MGNLSNQEFLFLQQRYLTFRKFKKTILGLTRTPQLARIFAKEGQVPQKGDRYDQSKQFK